MIEAADLHLHSSGVKGARTPSEAAGYVLRWITSRRGMPQH